MAVDFGTLIYAPNFDMWAIPVTFYPIVSIPLQGSYAARGIFDTRQLDVLALDGSIVSEQRTILDILNSEFSVIPMQGDRVDIPTDSSHQVHGMFEITDASYNAGGETTLTLKEVMVRQSP
jgi:hypothetical protein